MLRVALIGYGLAGAAFHGPFLTAGNGFALTAVVTRDPGRRALARDRHPRVRLLEDAAQAIDGSVCDLVVVAAPNRFHAPLALAALEAGLPVVVDKPVAPTADAVAVLAERERATRGLVIPFHNRRWDGDFLTLRALLRDGALGAVHRFESRFERFRPVPAAGWRERGDPSEGGGVLLDLGPHLVDQALVLFGPVETVHAEVGVRRAGGQVGDDAFLSLGHSSGVRSHLHMSLVAAHHGPRLRVLGTGGAFVKSGLDPQEDALRAGPGARPAVEPPAKLHRETGTEAIRVARGDYGAFYREVAVAVRDGSPPPVALADALAVARVLDTARGSS